MGIALIGYILHGNIIKSPLDYINNLPTSKMAAEVGVRCDDVLTHSNGELSHPPTWGRCSSCYRPRAILNVEETIYCIKDLNIVFAHSHTILCVCISSILSTNDHFMMVVPSPPPPRLALFSTLMLGRSITDQQPLAIHRA